MNRGVDRGAIFFDDVDRREFGRLLGLIHDRFGIETQPSTVLVDRYGRGSVTGGGLGHEGLEVEDVAAASVLHTSGALGTITGTTSSWPGWAKRIEISGTRGSAVLEDDSITRWDFDESCPEDKKILEAIKTGETDIGGAGDPTAIGWEGHRRQLTDFVEALTEGRDPKVTGEEARKSVAIITAIYQSAESGERTRPD